MEKLELCNIYQNEERIDKLLQDELDTKRKIFIDKRYTVCNGEIHYQLSVNDKMRIVRHDDNIIECPVYKMELIKKERYRKKLDI